MVVEANNMQITTNFHISAFKNSVLQIQNGYVSLAGIHFEAREKNPKNAEIQS